MKQVISLAFLVAVSLAQSASVGTSGIGTAHNLSVPLNCADTSASSTTYTCSTVPSFTPVLGDAVLFTTVNQNNSASSTLNVNGAGAKTIKKQQNAANIVSGDLQASATVLMIYDGTNWQMQGQVGNVAGITNGAGNNVIPKSNGTNLVASSITDNGTTISSAEQVTWATGLGAISQIQGPTDQNLALNAVTGKGITLGVNGASSITVTGSNTTVVDAVFPTGFLIRWNGDTGVSRDGGAIVDVGNGTAQDKSGTLQLANIKISGTIQNVAATATMGLTLKKGTGSGNYTTASTTYVVVDSTNLCNTVTIPTGWKLGVTVNGAIGTATGVAVASLALTDNAACSTANAGVLVETTETTTAAAVLQPVGLGWVVAGDGASHNIALQFKTANGADSATLANSSSTLLPTMVFTLMPSN